MKPQGTRRWQYLDQDTNFASPFCVLLFCDSASPFGEVFKPHLPDSPASFPQIPSLAESVSYHPTESTAPFKSLPVQEEMMTKYSNLSLESHNISVTAAPFTSLPVQEEMMTKSSNLSLESHSISMTAAPFISLPVQEEMMTKSSNLSLESHSISMTVEHSNMPVEKNITLERPSNVELICQFTPSGDLNSVNVTWKKGDKLLEDNYLVNATGGTLYTQHRVAVINSKQMGSYSCFFGEKKQQRGTFNLKVPEINGQNKPLITYLGDSVVLMCKCQDCLPLNWTWYGGNGSVQVPIGVPVNDKYVISGKHANETRLKITQLSEDDQGTYLCHAIFELGESEGHVKLVVLSYLVPLKVFCAIAAEVVLLVAAILLFEMYTQKKKKPSDDGKEFEQGEQLKLDDSNGIENSGPRHRKNEVRSTSLITTFPP
ncbi:embigin isoform X5 [Bos javanicus]|uniref:embigin isoform X5 n=1 Tax=Bos javanicus TaxID=9906 RepID=UPI002AA941EF|nr:embigin isoform X5 [Bos javanicus]